MKKIAVSVLALAVMLTASCTRKSARPTFRNYPDGEWRMPSITATRISAPPIIDGHLNDGAWGKAGTVKGDFRDAGSVNRSEKQTDVYTAFDTNCLYIAFLCHEPNPERIKIDEKQRDRDAWQDDCVELFIVTDPGKKDYRHLICNAAGVQYDEFVSPEFKSVALKWDARWESKTRIEKDSWSVEMAIPFSELGISAPVRGEKWKIKFCREDYTGAKVRKPVGLYSWPINPRSWNTPVGYAELVFEDRNIILNGSFEEPAVPSAPPAKWQYDNSGKPNDRIERSEGGAPDGRYYMTIVKRDAALASKPMLVNTAYSPLKGDRQYRLSGVAKTDGSAAVICKTFPKDTAKESGKGPRWMGTQVNAKEWTLFAYEFTTETWEDKCLVQVRMPYHDTAAGAISVDCLLLEQVVYDTADGIPAVKAEPDQGLRELALRFGQKPYNSIRRPDGTYPTERTVFRDTACGSEIWRMVDDFGGRHSIDTDVWNMNGARMYVFNWKPHVVKGKCILWAMDAKGGDIRLAAPPEHYPAGGTWSKTNPDIIYYLDMRKQGLWECNVMTLRTRLLHQFSKNDTPRFQGLSRDGKRLFVGRGDCEEVEKGWVLGWSMSLDGTDVREYRLAMKGDGIVKAIQDEGYPITLISHGHGNISPDRKRFATPTGEAWYVNDFGKSADSTLIALLQGCDHTSWTFSDAWLIGSADFLGGDNIVAKLFADGSGVVHPLSAVNTLVMFNYANEAHPVLSPDGTKVVFCSVMLGFQDMYAAVISRPLPPANPAVKSQGGETQITWAAPSAAKEIEGYYVYRSETSGGPYAQINREPVKGCAFTDKTGDGKPFAYVITAVEFSGLESVPSAEVYSGTWDKPVRIYTEAEFGTARMPMHEMRDAQSAANGHGMGICAKEGAGTAEYSIGVPKKANYRIWLRSRRNLIGQGATFDVAVNGKKCGAAVAKTGEWSWSAVEDSGQPSAMPLKEGTATLSISAAGMNNAIDKILLTDDPAFIPQGFGNLDAIPPAKVEKVKIVNAKPFEAVLVWQANPDPDLDHYNVYRSQASGFAVGQKHIIRSPHGTNFVDWGLRPGKTYYRITAVDREGNEGPASDEVVADLGEINTHTIFLEAEECVLSPPFEIVKDPKAGKGACAATPADGKSADGKIAAEFTAPEGIYAVWVRMAQTDINGTGFTLDIDGDTVVFQANLLWSLHGSSDVQRPTFHFEWQYVAERPIQQMRYFTLKDGKHRLLISKVPPGVVIDRIYITSDITKVPEDISGQGWR